MWQFVNAVGFHNKYFLGSLEGNIIWRATSAQIFVGAAGEQGLGHGGQLPPAPAGYAHVFDQYTN